MDEWFENMAAYFAANPSAPALAVDMAFSGPPADFVGHGLMRSMIRTEDDLDLYPEGR